MPRFDEQWRREAADLPDYPWISLRWLMDPNSRPDWYHPLPALDHVGELADTVAGRRKYLEYLAWLAEDEPARKQQRFDVMSKGWITGTADFAKTLVKENQELVGHGRRLAAELQETREALWCEELDRLRMKLGRPHAELKADRKSAPWKAALAAAMKARTTVTNRWLGENLNLGGLHEASRQVGVWLRQPDQALQKNLGSPQTTRPALSLVTVLSVCANAARRRPTEHVRSGNWWR